MRTLINYLRSCFCKHEWELMQEAHLSSAWTKKWTYRCKKCGYFKTYHN